MEKQHLDYLLGSADIRSLTITLLSYQLSPPEREREREREREAGYSSPLQERADGMQTPRGGSAAYGGSIM
jgi:hypothetical protein